MKRLSLEPTVLAQWHALVKEAEQAAGQVLKVDLEHYLILLLDRFSHQPDIALCILGEDYLESLQELGALRQLHLRDIGDKCLLFSGLFPERAEKRRVTVDYYVALGQQAYHLLSIYHKRNESAKLFEKLHTEFVTLMDTLHCMRELSGEGKTFSLLQAKELWHSAHNEETLKLFQRYINGFLIADESLVKKLH